MANNSITRTQLAEFTPFDNSTNGFLSDNVQDAIVEAKISGGVDNFSYHKIEQDKTISIPVNQHMICTSLEVDGFLILDGSLITL